MLALPAALDAIFGGLNKLDRNTAAGVAAKIFGRGASGDILQLARDAEGFAGALQADDSESVDTLEVVVRGRHSEIDPGKAKASPSPIAPTLKRLRMVITP